MANFDMFDGFGENDPRNMPHHLFFGAVHLDYSTAVRADISKQNFSVCPRYWYIDTAFRCTRCDDNFIFTTDEQRFWYEQLGFWIDSYAKQCASCRGELRHLKAMRQEYDRDIERVLVRDADPEQKRRLVGLVKALEVGGVELPERMRDNRRTLQKQLDRRSSAGAA